MNNRIGGGKPRPLRLPCVRFCARQFNRLSATARIGWRYCSIPSVRADRSLLTMLALDLRPHVPTGFHIPPSVERIFRYVQLHKIPYSHFRNFPLFPDVGSESPCFPDALTLLSNSSPVPQHIGLMRSLSWKANAAIVQQTICHLVAYAT